MSLIIILVGIVTWDRLQVRQYPKVDQPVISVWTQLEGASPQIIETQITKVLEDALAGIEGLYFMQSTSVLNDSKINLTFNFERDIEAAANDVRDKVARIRQKLPEGITDPRIRKADADAVPIIQMALYSDKHDIKELADYANRNLESQLEVINGVSSVDVLGGGEYEMRLVLDPVKLASFVLTVEDVVQALKRQNIEKPAGTIVSEDRELIITARAPLATEKDFDNIIIAERDGYLVRLIDVGKAKLDSIETKSRIRYNDKAAIGIALVKQSIANPLTIAKSLNKKLPQLRESLPQGMHLEVAIDQTVFIERSIDNVYQTLFEATVLVIFVILIFLRSFRAVIIPIVTIPISLIGTFALMYSLGFTINTLTLLALVLAIGLVVDDAIVMLENIYRHIEEGMKPLQAAFQGAKEISFAVIAMTITLAAVYAPIALSPGMTGKLFTEFALTLAGAVILSGFVALTLSPMMCGRLLKVPNHVKNKDSKDLSAFDRFNIKYDAFFDKVDSKYASFLAFLLEKTTKRLIVVGVGILIAIVGYFTFTSLKTELVPREDQGRVNVRAVPPFGASISFVNRYMADVERAIQNIDELQGYLMNASAPGESFIYAVVKPWEERDRTVREIANEVNPIIQDIPGLSAWAYPRFVSPISASSEKPVSIVVRSTKSFRELQKIVGDVMKAISKHPGVTQVEADIGKDEQELVVTIDREKAASLGIEIETIASTLDTLFGGKSSSKFKRENKQYSVNVTIADSDKRTPDDVSSIFVRGTKDRKETMVPLAELVTLEKKLTPVEIAHTDALRAHTIKGRLNEGFSMGQTLLEVKQMAYNAAPDGTIIDFSGESRRYFEENSNVITIFGLALLFIFLVLSAQYESWRDPWIILFSVPLSLTGGALMLWFFDGTNNLYSQIGFVTLIGLITKHGILIVDFANKLKADGKTRVDAVVEAAKLRLRPILMTTFAMVLGALPLAIATGAGMESRRPIGLVIVGGMTLGTLFTLFIVPAVYTFFSRKKAAAAQQGFGH